MLILLRLARGKLLECYCRQVDSLTGGKYCQEAKKPEETGSSVKRTSLQLSVSLARAIYSRASILLLDDVISAVDAETSSHIIEDCFKSELVTNRTVILASHSVEALASLASQAIFLEDGKAVWQGTGEGLLLSTHMTHLSAGPLENKQSRSEAASAVRRNGTLANGLFTIQEAALKTPRQIILEEEQAKGPLNHGIWHDFLRLNGSKAFWVALIFLILLTSLSPVAEREVLMYASLHINNES